jgi:hypothetical protein
VDAKLRDAATHGLHVTGQSEFEPLEPRDHHAADRRIGELVHPRRELRERPD